LYFKKTPVWEFFFCLRIYLYKMKNTELKNQVISIFEEIEQDLKTEIMLEGLSSSYAKLVKFLLSQVKTEKFKKNYDIDTNSGRLVFTTKGGKKIVFNDGKIGVTARKIWKGKKTSDFFDYKDHKGILKFSLAG